MVADRSQICRTQGPSRVIMKTPRPDEGYERVPTQYVFIRDLAQHMGRERSSLVIKARKRGVIFITARDPESGRTALAMTVADAKRLMDSEPPSVEIVKPEDIGRKA